MKTEKVALVKDDLHIIEPRRVISKFKAASKRPLLERKTRLELAPIKQLYINPLSSMSQNSWR